MNKYVVAITLGVCLLLGFDQRPNQPAAAKFDSIIVLKIDGITGDQYAKISEALDSDSNTHIEYACLWSGVMVIKLFNSTISNKGDAQMYIRTKVGQASPGTSVEYLHVYVEQSSGSTKC